MKRQKLFLTTLLAGLLVCGNVWAQTVTLQPSTILPNNGTPEHIYFVRVASGDNSAYYWGSSTYATTTTPAQYAFYAATDKGDGWYFIYSVTDQKWLDYDPKSGYESSGNNCTKMVDSKPTDHYWKIEGNSNLYEIHPHKTDGGRANMYLGYIGGVTQYTSTIMDIGSGSDNTKWYLEESLCNLTYQIRMCASQTYFVSATDDETYVQWTTSPDPIKTAFEFEYAGSLNQYYIYSVGKGKYLKYTDTSEGKNKVVYADSKDVSNTKWYIIDFKSKPYKAIVPASLDITSNVVGWNFHGGTSATKNVGLYQKSDDNSGWYLTTLPISNKLYTIRSYVKKSGSSNERYAYDNNGTVSLKESIDTTSYWYVGCSNLSSTYTLQNASSFKYLKSSGQSTAFTTNETAQNLYFATPTSDGFTTYCAFGGSNKGTDYTNANTNGSLTNIVGWKYTLTDSGSGSFWKFEEVLDKDVYTIAFVNKPEGATPTISYNTSYKVPYNGFFVIDKGTNPVGTDFACDAPDGYTITITVDNYTRVVTLTYIAQKTIYTIKYQIRKGNQTTGDVLDEESHNVIDGASYPACNLNPPAFVTLSTTNIPSTPVTSDAEILITYETKDPMPNLYSSVDEIETYYALDIWGNRGYNAVCNNNSIPSIMTNTNPEAGYDDYMKGAIKDDNYAWAFIGDPYTGVKVYNKGTKKYLYQPSDADVQVLFDTEDNATNFRFFASTQEKKASDDRSDWDKNKAFCLKNASRTYYINKRNSILQGWSDTDGGSSFRCYPITYEDCSLSQTLKGEYGTIILPFYSNIPSGLKVYSCSTVNGSNLTLTEESSMVKANTPYIVQQTSTPISEQTFTYEGTTKGSYTSAAKVGLLTGTYTALSNTTDEKVPAGSYVLLTKEGKSAFYQVRSGDEPSVPANRCYLTVTTGGEEIKAFYFDDDPTSIHEVDANVNVNANTIYNLAGQRVNGLQKGINIVNGKKVLY